MNKVIVFMAIGVAFLSGLTISSVVAQNTTTTYAPVVSSADSLITAIVAIIGSISALIITLANRGLLGKHSQQIGTVAVMAGDTAIAVKDTRQEIKDGLQTAYDTVKITSPEAAAKADAELAPTLDKATVRINEYKDKADRFAALAKKLSDGGEKADPAIAEMKDDIPDKIVPS